MYTSGPRPHCFWCSDTHFHQGQFQSNSRQHLSICTSHLVHLQVQRIFPHGKNNTIQRLQKHKSTKGTPRWSTQMAEERPLLIYSKYDKQINQCYISLANEAIVDPHHISQTHLLLGKGEAKESPASPAPMFGENEDTLCLWTRPMTAPIAKWILSSTMSLKSPLLFPFLTDPQSMSSGFENSYRQFKA